MNLEPFVAFIQKHHVLTLAVSDESGVWCASCFYAFCEQTACFIIASDLQTKHITKALKNSKIAGNIYLETKEVGKIEGLQFEATLQKATLKEKTLYLKAYPYALALNPTLWALHVNYMKLTDNKLGFGKKLEFRATNSTNKEA